MMQSIASFDLYGHDLTTLARESVFSCESETFLTTVERLFQILTRPHKNSAILLDWDEEARWQVVASLVHRLAHGQAPAPLCSWRVIALDYEKLSADLSKAELTTIQHRQVTPLERRFQAYCTTLLQSQERILLVVEDLPHLLGAHFAASPLDAAPVLVPILARNRLQLLATTTSERYRRFIERFAAISRRLQEVYMPPISPNSAPGGSRDN